MDLHTLAATAPAVGWALHTGWLARRLAAARKDPLTGLHTSAGWTARAERLIRRRPRTAAVLLVDLDNFKALNDTHGHAAGDFVLAAVASRLNAWCTRHGVAGRLGGDEFVAAVPDVDAAGLANLHADLHRPVFYLGNPLPLAASIGVCHLADLNLPALTNALSAADADMYADKGHGRRGRDFTTR